ncbi:exodeoxyribonuclease VII large subunit [Verminephrobacter eiseniae]|uniref:Exodeoxyribonuclease 7 large subunit n=1 Tax=Verminephrobacter eiseniae (strain EF01-2) TaxID=391735 RepID=A1WSH1_VEREI|nr:exodeoxyribonuclease VII large subunit [Verminephrobacter eiseniae]ABM60578.1 Exodeoxyribonuclease VII large subunit [Verminephrobacter eiseniae EF01-2]MCW5286051.1 exodeoxyribonuclease VII large subunit [Verminephrobacter eiseniae]MCW5304349.1 exodeoxyribonuclease VII large subunit [Verminephrobacter eiseniae]MCW8182743.1 exodeoxyribonuclease VII large subunit [Verminephrobacter eiseniae]MCW8190634.1 exodeoxyribonuclease VII large subunit [Verminephrobacter eiseniae]
MFERPDPIAAARVWEVGALCRAIADALQVRFNPVAVRGEITGLTRASSGHCYFSIKDMHGQLRCAMFRRAASGLDFAPRDGQLVQLHGRLGVYEARGELQFIVEGMQQAGQGALFEQFLQLKARLELQGLFDNARKRPLPALPRGIGLVTSPGAAALHDVVTALRRRVPHIPVLLVPAQVQGVAAAPTIIAALAKLYGLAQAAAAPGADTPAIDVILLVRGGGSIEDLWAFNDEQLARMIVQSPVPLVSGVGHETDFTIADFCADLRAPTPTAAAELVAQPREFWLAALDLLVGRIRDGAQRQLDARHQRLDQAAARLGRPSGLVAGQQLQLARLAQRMRHGVLLKMQQLGQTQQALQTQLPQQLRRRLGQHAERLERTALHLELLDPRLVLQRGYALLTDTGGQAVTRVRQARPGAALRATLADGTVDVTVAPRSGAGVPSRQ